VDVKPGRLIPKGIIVLDDEIMEMFDFFIKCIGIFI